MRKILFLDRDGVLNRIVIHPEQGTIDSPMQVSEVEIFSWVPEALKALKALGFQLVIATNQPAAAKGKTTIAQLQAVHSEVIRQCGPELIEASLICFHRQEDGCNCRKPKPGLLMDYVHATAAQGPVDLSQSWMVGDGVTDVQAGVAAGVRTAFLGPRKCDACKIMDERSLTPDFWGSSLFEFAQKMMGK